jgi:uncharacterized protein YecE (DUF72 family)
MPAVDMWMRERRVARVMADPVLHPGGDRPGGWRGLSYYRLHGSPRIYYSRYRAEWLARLSRAIEDDPAPSAFSIFDNTPGGAATLNALELERAL